MFNREAVAATLDELITNLDLTLKLPDSKEYMIANAITSAGGLFATVELPDIPGLACHVKQPVVYQRAPNWIAPYDSYRAAVPKHMDWILDNMPYYCNWHGSAALIRGMQLPPFPVGDPKWRPKGGLINA